MWPNWREGLEIVKADTVVGWQGERFRIYWAKISQRKGAGRPQARSDVRAFIKKMAPAWGERYNPVFLPHPTRGPICACSGRGAGV